MWVLYQKSTQRKHIYEFNYTFLTFFSKSTQRKHITAVNGDRWAWQWIWIFNLHVIWFVRLSFGWNQMDTYTSENVQFVELNINILNPSCLSCTFQAIPHTACSSVQCLLFCYECSNPLFLHAQLGHALIPPWYCHPPSFFMVSWSWLGRQDSFYTDTKIGEVI